MMMRSAVRWLIPAALGALALATPAMAGGPEAPSPHSSDPVVRGAYVFNTASCGSCHHPPGVSEGSPIGGRPIHTDFGVFYGTNLSPDPSTGIGGFTEADLRRALREGRGPNGQRYWPVFPYGSYTGMSDGDIADLYAYLMSQEAVEVSERPHELAGSAKIPLALRVWRMLYLDVGPLERDEAQGDVWNRGAYLVQAVAHCGECHTPRTRLGGLKKKAHLSGAPYHAGLAPNLTPDPSTGLGDWSAFDWDTFLTGAMSPDGDVVGGEMGAIVDLGTSRLTPEDRQAMITYLMALPPMEGLGEGPDADEGDDDEEDLW